MLKSIGAIALSSTLSAAVLIGAPTPSGNEGTPIVNGHGEWETGIGTVGFQVSLVELPGGSLQGHGVSYLHSESGNGWFHFEVTEYAFVGDELAVAGIITETFNTPPQFLGSLTVLIIQDNDGNGALPDKALSASGLPPSLSLDDILNGPPPDLRFPLAHGNFQIH